MMDNLTADEKHIGVIISTGHGGVETRVSVKRYIENDTLATSEYLTIGLYVGDGRWIETELNVRDAARLAALIHHKAA